MCDRAAEKLLFLFVNFLELASKNIQQCFLFLYKLVVSKINSVSIKYVVN